MTENSPPRLQREMFTSASVEWGTPHEFFDLLDAEFRFTLDVCATDDNAKCSAYYTHEDDGLKRVWTGVCWMNPPYGRQIGRWVERAFRASRAGATVVCLIPARTDTAYWHDYVMQADEIRLVRGRLRFDGQTGSAAAYVAPFPCAVVVFRPDSDGLTVRSIARSTEEAERVA